MVITKIKNGSSSLKKNKLTPRKEMATGRRPRLGKTAPKYMKK